MFSDPIFGLVAFVAAYIISRIISEGALQKLSNEEKALLVGSFSSHRIYSLITTFSLVIAYLFLTKFFWQYDHIVTPLFFAVIFIVLLGNGFYAHRKLRSLGISDSYLKAFWLSAIIQYTGLIFLFSPALAKYFNF
jgi:hypothetical protein